ncbi:DUF6517 family protein [Haloarchaeobius amylolyticus]|uniref:DUF6517 family protein n=1 Tax=Haloarchaeobius amylolyticus TaxID=1198296 RepID=UPI0022701A3C|nr:DUF6517 family protein [Haloarchaeobius amylolyticus]
MDTRRGVAALAIAVLLVSSGCLGFVTGEEPLEYAASQATVADGALGESGTGYEQTKVENQTLRIDGSEVGIGDRTIVVDNWVAQYEKQDDFIDQQVGLFAVVSTHEVDVVGRPMNPVRNMSNADLLDRVLGQYQTGYGSISNVRQTGTEQVTMLGQQTEVGVFVGETSLNGQTVEISLYVTKVKHGDDYVIAIGGHPTKLPNEEDDIYTLMQNVEHDADEE